MKRDRKKTRLHLARDVLRLLQTYELRDIAGGNTTDRQETGDSKAVCCA